VLEPGRLIVLAAPSGAGKTTLVHELLAREPQLKFSISYTTRPQRDTEVDGEDYFFISEDEFFAMRAGDAFLECAEVFDNWYGTSQEYIQSLLDQGRSVLLEIDWQGAAQVRSRRPDAVCVFIMPPSRSELERRLRGRRTDAEEIIQRRLRDAFSDMAHWHEFDYVVINDDLDKAAVELEAIVGAGRAENRTSSPEIQARVEAILTVSQ
jgi:guanylate kinase